MEVLVITGCTGQFVSYWLTFGIDMPEPVKSSTNGLVSDIGKAFGLPSVIVSVVVPPEVIAAGLTDLETVGLAGNWISSVAVTVF